MNGFDEQLEKYAELAVKTAINIQKGQTLVINAPISTAEFVRNVAERAYKAGAKHVHVEWGDDPLTLIKFLNAPDEAFEEFPMWKAKGMEEMAENDAAFLSIHAPNPDLLKDVDPEKVATVQKTGSKAMKTFAEYTMKDKVSWSVISVPTKEWAAKVFPDLDNDDAIRKLWETIFQMTRVDREDPVQAWEEHQHNLSEKLRYLNDKCFKKLHYKAPGTDLTIELPKGHQWVGPVSTKANGVQFIANVPTEEVFTLPLKTGVNGMVKSTKPLNYGGTMIEDFSFTFKDGRIVDFQAEEGYETLKQLIDTEEDSHYLGEVALVPYDSPISKSGLLFYNTLFDENASCHLAIGQAYGFCLQGGTEMDEDELKEHGVNSSLVHVDFMIGSPELAIDGETHDGKIEPVFRNGNWAF